MSELDTGRIAKAKQLCAACPVKAHCLAAGLGGREYGIWGGTTESERRTIRAELLSGTGAERVIAA